MVINHSLLLAGLFLSLVLGVTSSDSSAADPKKHAEAALICETTALTPGTTGWIGVHFKIEKDWHLYWNGLNDTGFPIEAKLEGPTGYKIGELRWPAPLRHLAPGDELDHIYENAVTLVAPVEVPSTASGTATFTAKLSWLVCSKACVPEDATVSVSVPVAAKDASVEKPPANSKAFDEARARWPKPLADAGLLGPKVAWKGNGVTISAPSATQLAFFPNADCTTIDNLAKSTLAAGNTLTMQLQPDKGVEPVLRGILEVRSDSPSKGAVAWYQLELRPSSLGAPTPQPPTSPTPPGHKPKGTN